MSALVKTLDAEIPEECLIPVARLRKDEMAAVEKLGPRDIRFLVRLYYQEQDRRIESAARVRESIKAGEPNELITWYLTQAETLEKQVHRILSAYARYDPLGRRMLNVPGIGPVITSGILAHIDWRRVKYPGSIERFAGLDPTVKWAKGQTRPWNADLKVLFWKASRSWNYMLNNDKSFYSKLFVLKQEELMAKNERHGFAEDALRILSEKNWGKDTEARKAYEAGQLPKAHINARAWRHVIKIFINHLWQTKYKMDNGGKEPPTPYAIERLGHLDYVAPPEFWD